MFFPVFILPTVNINNFSLSVGVLFITEKESLVVVVWATISCRFFVSQWEAIYTPPMHVRLRTYIQSVCFFVCMCVEESIYSYSFLLILFFWFFFGFFGRFPSSHLIWRNKQRHPSSSSHHICWFVDNFLYRNHLDVSRMSCFIVRLYTICIVGERTGVTMSLAFQLLFTFFLYFCFLFSIASSRPIFNRHPTFRRIQSQRKRRRIQMKRYCFECVVY